MIKKHCIEGTVITAASVAAQKLGYSALKAKQMDVVMEIVSERDVSSQVERREKRSGSKDWQGNYRGRRLWTYNIYMAVKDRLKKEEYVDDLRDRIGARLKFKFRTRSAGLGAEVGYWKNREESRECVMCSEEEDEYVEHVMMRCEAYRSERECAYGKC